MTSAAINKLKAKIAALEFQRANVEAERDYLGAYAAKAALADIDYDLQLERDALRNLTNETT